MAHLWKRIFKKRDHASTCLERAIEAQAAFERQHQIPYAADQRAVALTQRFLRLYGAETVPTDIATLIRDGARDWQAAAQAAETTK